MGLRLIFGAAVSLLAPHASASAAATAAAPWAPSAACQAAANAACNAMNHSVFGPTVDHGKSCWADIRSRPCDGPQLARKSLAHGTTEPAWRCYSPSTLTKDHAAYAKGDCYCSLDVQIRALLAKCGSPDPSPAPTPTPAPTFAVPSVAVVVLAKLRGNNAENRVGIAAAGGTEAVVAAMRAHGGNAEVQWLGQRARRVLGA